MRHLKKRYLVIGGFAFGLSTLLAASWVVAQDLELPDAPGTTEATEDAAYEDLNRGPVHEAYAEQFNLDPQPGPLVTRRPPEPIDELPPEIKPAGDVHFVPGYWAWSDDRDDFIWVSGVWRQFPPDRRFVPGYWAEVEGGWRWAPGTWTPIENDELAYLPEPPESLEAGPTGPSPSADYFWVPGCWQYRNTNYVWQPGYWSQGYASWTWIPNRYHWTPRGYIYTAGYWDYPFARRGLLFAPRYFRAPIYLRAGYRYTARVALAPARLLYHLFARPHYHHYYFGNYYGPTFVRRGYSPWYKVAHRRGHGFDPLFNHYRWDYARRGIDYRRHLDGWHNYYTRNERYRPAETFRGQAALDQRLAGDSHRNRSILSASLNNVAALNIGTQLVLLNSDDRQRQARFVGDFRNIAQARSAFERDGDRRDSGSRGPASRGDAEPGLRNRLPADGRDPSNRDIARGRSSDSRSRETLKLPAGLADRPSLRGADGRGPTARTEADARARLLPGNRSSGDHTASPGPTLRDRLEGRTANPRARLAPGSQGSGNVRSNNPPATNQPGPTFRGRTDNGRGDASRGIVPRDGADRTRTRRPDANRSPTPGGVRNLLPGSQPSNRSLPNSGPRSLGPRRSGGAGSSIRRGPSTSGRPSGGPASNGASPNRGARSIAPRGSAGSSSRSGGRTILPGANPSRPMARPPGGSSPRGIRGLGPSSSGRSSAGRSLGGGSSSPRSFSPGSRSSSTPSFRRGNSGSSRGFSRGSAGRTRGSSPGGRGRRSRP